MGDVLQFPKYQSARMRAEKKIQERRAILALSVGSIMLMTVFINQVLVRHQTKGIASARGIASVEGSAAEAPGLESIQKDALRKWESTQVNKLSGSEMLGSPVQRAIQPGLHDQLVFGLLEGRYNVQLNKGKITGLEFNSQQKGVDPVALDNAESLLREFKSEFAPVYHEVKRVPASDTAAIEYQLLDHGTQRGVARFEMKDGNKVMSIKFQTNE